MELAQLGMRTGLKVATCEDLLKRGWRYVEELNKPARWVRDNIQDQSVHISEGN